MKPDNANAPTSSADPTYKSYGGRNIAIGAMGGAGLGKIATMGKVATSQTDDSGPMTELYHGGQLNRNGKKSFSTTNNPEHAAQYAKQHGGSVHSYIIPTKRLFELERTGQVSRLRDNLHGTSSSATEWRFLRNSVSELKKK
jgi:hypothetical protein